MTQQFFKDKTAWGELSIFFCKYRPTIYFWDLTHTGNRIYSFGFLWWRGYLLIYKKEKNASSKMQ